MRDVFSVLFFLFCNFFILVMMNQTLLIGQLKKTTTKNVKKHSAFGLLLSPTSSCLENLIKHCLVYELLHHNRERTKKNQIYI